jgi:hypothetical protein
MGQYTTVTRKLSVSLCVFQPLCYASFRNIVTVRGKFIFCRYVFYSNLAPNYLCCLIKGPPAIMSLSNVFYLLICIFTMGDIWSKVKRHPYLHNPIKVVDLYTSSSDHAAYHCFESELCACSIIFLEAWFRRISLITLTPWKCGGI